jgi:hypothetical protein
MFARTVALPDTRSFFLFGPGQTGKSFLIHAHFSENSWLVNRLRSVDFVRYFKHPEQYRLF